MAANFNGGRISFPDWTATAGFTVTGDFSVSTLGLQESILGQWEVSGDSIRTRVDGAMRIVVDGSTSQVNSVINTVGQIYSLSVARTNTLQTTISIDGATSASASRSGDVMFNNISGVNGGAIPFTGTLSGVWTLTNEDGSDPREYDFDAVSAGATTIPNTAVGALPNTDATIIGNVTLGNPPPAITITNGTVAGGVFDSVAVDSTYTPPAATALDATDGSIAVTIDTSALDITTAGFYPIVYTATNSAGVTDTVIVSQPVGWSQPPALNNPSFDSLNTTIIEQWNLQNVVNQDGIVLIDRSRIDTYNGGYYFNERNMLANAGKIANITRNKFWLDRFIAMAEDVLYFRDDNYAADGNTIFTGVQTGYRNAPPSIIATNTPATVWSGDYIDTANANTGDIVREGRNAELLINARILSALAHGVVAYQNILPVGDYTPLPTARGTILTGTYEQVFYDIAVAMVETLALYDGLHVEDVAAFTSFVSSTTFNVEASYVAQMRQNINSSGIDPDNILIWNHQSGMYVADMVIDEYYPSLRAGGKTRFGKFRNFFFSLLDGTNTASGTFTTPMGFYSSNNSYGWSYRLADTIFEDYDHSIITLEMFEVGHILGVVERSQLNSLNRGMQTYYDADGVTIYDRMFTQSGVSVTNSAIMVGSSNYFTDSTTLQAQFKTAVDNIKGSSPTTLNRPEYDAVVAYYGSEQLQLVSVPTYYSSTLTEIPTDLAGTETFYEHALENSFTMQIGDEIRVTPDNLTMNGASRPNFGVGYTTGNYTVWRAGSQVFASPFGIIDFQAGSLPVIPVTNITELNQAIANNQSTGAIIELATGSYDNLLISGVTQTETTPYIIRGMGSSPLDTVFDLDGAEAIEVLNSSYIAFANLSTSTGLDGIEITGSNHIVVDNVEVYNSRQGGILINKNSSFVDVIDSHIHDTGTVNSQFGEGIYIGTGGSADFPDVTTNIWIENNEINNTGNGEGIDIKPEAFDVTVRNNNIHDIAPGTAQETQVNQAAISVSGRTSPVHEAGTPRNIWIEDNAISNVVGGSLQNSSIPTNNGIMFSGIGVHIYRNTLNNIGNRAIYGNSFGDLNQYIYLDGNTITNAGSDEFIDGALSDSLSRTTNGVNPNSRQAWYVPYQQPQPVDNASVFAGEKVFASKALLDAMGTVTYSGLPQHDGATGAVLTDADRNFIEADLIGGTVYNQRDGSSGVITAATVNSITAPLSGGTNNTWILGDEYLIFHPENGIFGSESTQIQITNLANLPTSLSEMHFRLYASHEAFSADQSNYPNELIQSTSSQASRNVADGRMVYFESSDLSDRRLLTIRPNSNTTYFTTAITDSAVVSGGSLLNSNAIDSDLTTSTGADIVQICTSFTQTETYTHVNRVRQPALSLVTTGAWDETLCDTIRLGQTGGNGIGDFWIQGFELYDGVYEPELEEFPVSQGTLSIGVLPDSFMLKNFPDAQPIDNQATISAEITREAAKNGYDVSYVNAAKNGFGWANASNRINSTDIDLIAAGNCSLALIWPTVNDLSETGWTSGINSIQDYTDALFPTLELLAQVPSIDNIIVCTQVPFLNSAASAGFGGTNALSEFHYNDTQYIDAVNNVWLNLSTDTRLSALFRSKCLPTIDLDQALTYSREHTIASATGVPAVQNADFHPSQLGNLALSEVLTPAVLEAGGVIEPDFQSPPSITSGLSYSYGRSEVTNGNVYAVPLVLENTDSITYEFISYPWLNRPTSTTLEVDQPHSFTTLPITRNADITLTGPGGSTNVTLSFTMTDDEAPFIAINVNGGNVANGGTLTLNIGDTFNPSFSSTDTGAGNDTNITESVITNDVDTSVAGTYTYTVSAEDSVGNERQASITVIVLDNTPTITPFSFTPITNATINESVQSNAVTLSITNGPVALSAPTIGDILVNGQTVTYPATVDDGDVITIGGSAPSNYGETRIFEVVLLGQTYPFEVTTINLVEVQGDSIEAISTVGTANIEIDSITVNITGNSIESLPEVGTGTIANYFTEYDIQGNNIESQSTVSTPNVTLGDIVTYDIQGSDVTSYSFVKPGNISWAYDVKGNSIESISLSGRTYKFNPRIKLNLH